MVAVLIGLAAAQSHGATTAPGEMAASEMLGADLPTLLAWLEQHQPELQAAAANSSAAQARVQPAGALPDPVFTTELRDVPTSRFTLSPNRVGSVLYSLRQELPFWGKRALRREIAQSEARELEASRQQLRNELRARVTALYGERYLLATAAHITDDLIGTMARLEDLARTRYATGFAPQQDVLRARVERSALEMERLDLERDRARSDATLNAALGRGVEAPLAAAANAPPPVELPATLAALTARLATQNPELAMQRARIDAASAAERAVQRDRFPDFALAAGPVQESDRVDKLEIMFEVTLPLQQRTRRSHERAAQALRLSAEFGEQAVRARLEGDLGQAWVAARSAERQLALLRERLLPEAQLTLRAATASYESGQVDFATLLEAQRELRRTRLAELRLELERQQQMAEIRRIVGEDP